MHNLVEVFIIINIEVFIIIVVKVYFFDSESPHSLNEVYSAMTLLLGPEILDPDKQLTDNTHSVTRSSIPISEGILFEDGRSLPLPTHM